MIKPFDAVKKQILLSMLEISEEDLQVRDENDGHLSAAKLNQSHF